MLYKESKYIYQLLQKLRLNNQDLLLNIGSSTRVFRTDIQPYINKVIFSRLNNKVIHIDIKNEEGVDLVGNIMEEEFQVRIIDLYPKVILCNNILEHIQERKLFIDTLYRILPTDSFILITVPYKFPYHEDPIDTLYRPSLSYLIEDFKNFRFVNGKIISCGFYFNFMEYNLIERIKKTIKIFMKIFLSIVYPHRYFVANNAMMRIKVTCALFTKT